MMIKKITLSVLVGFFCFILKAQNSNDISTITNLPQTRIVAPFNKIIVNAPLSVSIIPGNEEKVIIDPVSATLLGFLATDSKDGVLTITIKNKPNNVDGTAKVTIYCKNLNSIIGNNKANIVLSTKLASDKLAIELANNTSLTATLSATKLALSVKNNSVAIISVEDNNLAEIDAHNNATVTIKGTTKKLVINTNNNTTIDASALEASKVSVDANNNATVMIFADEKYNADANNKSTIKVKGKGKADNLRTKNGGVVVPL